MSAPEAVPGSPAAAPPGIRYGRWEGGEPVFLGNPVTDALANVCLELAAQVWVLKTRLHHLEHAVRVEGQAVGELVESFEPSDEELAAWQEERQRFVADVLRPVMALEGVMPGGEEAAGPPR